MHEMTLRSLEAVLRRALAALQKSAPTSYPDQGQYSAFYAEKEHNDTIAALQAALTRPTTEDSSAVEPVQEPVCWYDPTDFTRTTNQQTEKEYAPLYAAPPQRTAEPVQEPQERWCSACGEYVTTRCLGEERACVWNWYAIRSAPPQRPTAGATYSDAVSPSS